MLQCASDSILKLLFFFMSGQLMVTVPSIAVWMMRPEYIANSMAMRTACYSSSHVRTSEGALVLSDDQLVPNSLAATRTALWTTV